jgi:hypothetical protein
MLKKMNFSISPSVNNGRVKGSSPFQRSTHNNASQNDDSLLLSEKRTYKRSVRNSFNLPL